MSQQPSSPTDGAALLGLYDAGLPMVYGYLLARTRHPATAQDLTAETFLAAVDAVRRPEPVAVSTGWLVGVARHKLVDHWRREARDQRGMRALTSAPPSALDPWDERLDALQARAVLDRLPAMHRTVLTLRYLDDLSVPAVAAVIGRSLHATEALLVRARAGFRRAYDGGRS